MSINFLEKIITTKRQRLESVGAAQSLESLRVRALEARRAAPAHAFRRALTRNDGLNVIAEIKRRSPSRGAIREITDVGAFGSRYERAGAVAISVLTDEEYFAGSIDDLHDVREAVSIPILRKDFIIDEYQVYESAIAGADAVLLIVAALTDDQLSRLGRIAENELEMDALVEVHTVNEMRRALDHGATLIGVNNRNLKTFEVSVSTSVTMAREAPPHVLLVSESGIHSRDELLHLASLGYQGFLIGESLLRSEDPTVALSVLVHDNNGPKPVRVKICGITNVEDAQACVSAGANMLGFNFYRQSPRYIAAENARSIIEQLPSDVMSVGVFVNEANPQLVTSIADAAGVRAIQLHGDETHSFCQALDDRFIIKAFRVNQNLPSTIRDYAVDAILLDSFQPNIYGGTGSRFDWSLAKQAKRFTNRLILAGGLTPNDVAAAIETVRPYAVDVCSSLESKPGVKDQSRVRQFMAVVKQGEQKARRANR